MPFWSYIFILLLEKQMILESKRKSKHHSESHYLQADTFFPPDFFFTTPTYIDCNFLTEKEPHMQFCNVLFELNDHCGKGPGQLIHADAQLLDA